MPNRPRHPCAHPGCPELISYGEKDCEKHAPLHTEEKKDKRIGGSAARGYGWRWQKAGKAYLHAHPLCAESLGLFVPGPTPPSRAGNREIQYGEFQNIFQKAAAVFSDHDGRYRPELNLL